MNKTRQKKERTTSYSKEEIQDYLSREDLCYQKIALPHGLFTPGESRKDDHLITKDLQGKSVLDVGSFLGKYCFEAIAGGAVKAVGLEINDKRRLQAQQLSKFLGYHHIEFRKCDLDSGIRTEKFDVVLLLNVLHRLKDPLRTIHELMDIAQDRLVIEFAGFGKEEARLVDYSSAFSKMNAYPVIWAAEGNLYLPGDRSKTFFMSLLALKNILTLQTPKFSKLDVYNRGFKDRYLVVAHKRKIGHLIIVAHPFGCEVRDFVSSSQFTMHFPSILSGPTFDVITCPELFTYKKTEVPGLILLYDMVSKIFSDVVSDYSQDRIFDLLDCADKVTVITLCQEASSLRIGLSKKKDDRSLLLVYNSLPSPLKRITLGVARVARKIPLFKRNLPITGSTNLRLKEFYAQDQPLKNLYEKWNEFCTKKKLKNILVDLHTQQISRKK